MYMCMFIGPSSAVGAGDASSSVDSVFRSLMSKIKSLERNYAIIELYTIQVSLLSRHSENPQESIQ